MAPAWTVALAVVAVAGIAAFLWQPAARCAPMLPLDLFRSRRLVAALVATFTMTFGIYGLLLVNSFAFQQQRGASALATALWFLPMPVTYLVLIPLVNALAHRTGPRLPMTAGLGPDGRGHGCSTPRWDRRPTCGFWSCRSCWPARAWRSTRVPPSGWRCRPCPCGGPGWPPAW